MWEQFFFENAHFAIHLFAALSFFAVFWLYLDAWKDNKLKGSLACLIGFLLLSLSFFLRAAFLESSILTTSFFGASETTAVYLLLRNIGYILIIFGVLADKFQPRPTYASQVVFTSGISAFSILQFCTPVLAIVTGVIYLLKSTIGLERHLRPISITFFVLGMSEIFALRTVFQDTQNVDIYNLVAPFGPMWIAEHFFIFLASFMLARWVFGYLLKQFEPQLFMILSSLVLTLFLIITVAFTGLLLKNIEDQTLNELRSDVAVLKYSLDSKSVESISDAQVIAQNISVIDALKNDDRATLNLLTEQFLLSKKESTLIIVNESGQVVARGEDREKTGDSVSSDRLVVRALLGESVANFVSSDGLISPTISIRAAAPIKDNDKIIGAVMLGTNIDNAFVADIRLATGLEVSLYGDNIISATTLLALDNKSPLVGITEQDEKIRKVVLLSGEGYESGVVIAGRLYFASYLPLLDVDKNPIGMLFVGRPQISVLQTASRSIELTFGITVALLIASILPSFLIARYISNQLK
jgi:Double sensory domain of two-component sensor kinase